MALPLAFVVRVGALWAAYVVMIAMIILAPAIPLGKRVGQVSNENRTLLTPAGYAFSVWTLIFILQAAFMVYQSRKSTASHAGINCAAPFIFWAFVTNAAWLPVFQFEFFSLSFVVLATNLWLLAMVYRKLRIGDPQHSLGEAVLFSGFAINLAWVSVATVLNLSTALLTAQWSALSPSDARSAAGVDWSVMWLAVLGAASAFKAAHGFDVAHAGTTLWAIWAVHAARRNDVGVERIQGTVVALTVLLPIALLVGAANRRWRWWGHGAVDRKLDTLHGDARSLALALRTLASVPSDGGDPERQEAAAEVRVLG